MQLLGRRFGRAALVAMVGVLAVPLSTVAVFGQITAPSVFESIENVPDLKCPPVGRTRRAATASQRLREGPPELEEVEPLRSLRPAALDAPSITAAGPKLQRLLPDRPLSHPLRIGIWGDSHSAAGLVSAELSRILRQRVGGVSAGYLPPTMGRAGVAGLPIRKYCMNSDWTLDAAYIAKHPMQTGPALANRRSTAPGAYLWIDFRDPQGQALLEHVIMHYAPTTNAAVLRIQVDARPAETVSLPATPPGDGRLRGLKIDGAGRHLSTVKVTVVSGTLRLSGFELARAEPGSVVLDTFGLPSATIRGWAMLDAVPREWEQSPYGYDYVILQYGTNDSAVLDFDLARYRQSLVEALANMRATFPAAQCLMIGPPDRGVSVRAKAERRKSRNALTDLLRWSRVHADVSRTQREVGETFGCSAWNWQSAMGGPGSAYAWYYASPRLMSRDLIHLTAAGYRKSTGTLASFIGLSPDSEMDEASSR